MTGIIQPKILVMTHKPYRMPADSAYIPVQVGAAGKATIEGCVRDDSGANISSRNPHWCELTGLYWAWKNLHEGDAVGLVHYRRHFRGVGGAIASGAEIAELLGKSEAVLPKARNYFIETNYSQYVHAHHAVDLDTTRAIIAERHPGYLEIYDEVMNRTKGHRFNMFVMRRRRFEEYCEWLFDVLFELESRLDISGYSPYDARVFGFVSERLLDVWLEHNAVVCRELPLLSLESQHWVRKIANFLARKFLKRRGNGD